MRMVKYVSLIIVTVPSLPLPVVYSSAVGLEVQATPLSDLPASSPESPPKTPKKNRCFVCRKKVGLTGVGTCVYITRECGRAIVPFLLLWSWNGARLAMKELNGLAGNLVTHLLTSTSSITSSFF